MSDHQHRQNNIVRFNEILGELLARHGEMSGASLAELISEVFRLGQATGPDTSATITVIGLGYQAGTKSANGFASVAHADNSGHEPTI